MNENSDPDHGASERPEPPAQQKGNDSWVVGLGASAGGIKAFKEFFTHVPSDSGLAYVVILHLSPEHESHLAEILQMDAQIPVTQVTRTVRIERDHAYVIPPNQSLSIQDGELRLSEITRIEERRAPVDIFFRTLAETNYTRSICVILSGTGANGSMGLKRVKEFGGIAIVQDPKEAEYGDMPRNAIATGLVDYILPVAEMPARIIAYKDHLREVRLTTQVEQPGIEERALHDIFTHLRVRTGHDFTNYKRSTILRRIERRMNVRELPDLAAYARYLREHPDEVHSLLKDLLISVTNFFRDSGAFKSLEKVFIPRLFENKHANNHVRVWVAGCATGEEAYSISMLLSEYGSDLIDAPTIQVFATDIDEHAIAVAREGFYTDTDVADISPERLRQFFTKEPDGYRVRRELREMVLFASHNVIKDPPFSHLNLVSCRNLLIYLNRTAQERVMEVLHFALRPGGFLFLGESESVNGPSDLFVIADKEHRIFESRAVSSRTMIPVPEPMYSKRIDARQREESVQETRTLERLSYVDLHQRLLELYGPPSVVVNEEYDIVHLSEHAGIYMQMGGGEPSHNLLKIVRPELRLELRTALYQAIQKRTNVEARGLRINVDGRNRAINLVVRPVLRENDSARGFILILFEEQRGTMEVEIPVTGELVTSVEPAARHLEEELMRVKTQLRATIEQYEVQHEELKASNEELQAMNEELRSAAEELETSKEELQSVNEELTTVNQELKIKIEELSQANNDFQNLMASTEIGTIFLDRSLRVKLFTPRARDIFNLIPADVNRPLLDITNKLRYNRLLEDVDRVLNSLQTAECEVQTHNDRWYLMRLLPYRTTEDRIDGVVITFLDITERKRAEEFLRTSEEHLRVSHDELEVRIKDRTSALQAANEALRKEVQERRAAEERTQSLLQKLITVQEDERNRIARDLHDQMGQPLTALRLKLELLKEQAAKQPKLEAQIEQAQEMCRRVDLEADFLAWKLRPAVIDELGVVTSINNFVHEWSKHVRVEASFQTSGVEAMKGWLSSEIEINLYRITQEALNNIYKHSKATQVDVIIEWRDQTVILIIEDNGQGFEIRTPGPQTRSTEGIGLVTMRERVAHIGGTLEIETGPGKGTTIFVRVPVSSNKNDS
ncbi:MAG TPA: CheR family methyltransferase [Blastocatellia bacterium]|nr:CheR family methyltransferase [Blastocatellia bacterium]